MEDIKRLKDELQAKSAEQILSSVIRYSGMKDVALASSFSAEDQVLTHMVRQIASTVRIFTLDTGRLSQETYDCMHKTMRQYNFHYHVYCPETEKLEKMISQNGPNLFYESVENRKFCCHVRKVEPLGRALKGLKAWICGMRRVQGVTRSEVEVIEWDDINGLVKVNPLVFWTDEQVWAYIRENKIPYNALHDQGYPSIGCLPCTRAVKPGEDVRAGRWWWEAPEHKECGLHNRPRK